MAEVNMNIHDGVAFFAQETSINFSPGQMVLDFKNVTPRIDPRNKQGPTFVLQHSVIVIDPYHAKQLHNILGDAIKKYETEFAKIEKSKAILKAEKKQKDKPKSAPEVPHYMG
jgi:hypothetical protein